MNAETPISLLIISKQVLYLEALKSLFNSDYQRFEINVMNLNNVESLNKKYRSEIILLDANGMGKDIWNFLKGLHTSNPEIKILLLSNSNEQIYLDYAEKNGAKGFVLKSSPKEILIGAIKIVYQGGRYFDPGQEPKNNNGFSYNNVSLTMREMEIIRLIKDGNSSNNIANTLGLSPFTIQTHRKNIYKKLQVNKVTDLLRVYNEFEK